MHNFSKSCNRGVSFHVPKISPKYSFAFFVNFSFSSGGGCLKKSEVNQSVAACSSAGQVAQ